MCQTVKKRAEDDLTEVLFKRVGSGTDSEYDSDGNPLVEKFGGVTTLFMKGKTTVDKEEAISVAGVNGCTAVFFFNDAQTSRTGGHCTGSDEAKIAKTTAKKAQMAGNIGKAVIRAPTDAVLREVKEAILTVFTPTSWDVATYPYGKSSDNDRDCFAFTYKAGSNSLEESWQKM